MGSTKWESWAAPYGEAEQYVLALLQQVQLAWRAGEATVDEPWLDSQPRRWVALEASLGQYAGTRGAAKGDSERASTLGSPGEATWKEEKGLYRTLFGSRRYAYRQTREAGKARNMTAHDSTA